MACLIHWALGRRGNVPSISTCHSDDRSESASLRSQRRSPPLTMSFFLRCPKTVELIPGTLTCRCSSGGCSCLEEGWRAASSTPAEPGKRFLTPVNEPAHLPAEPLEHNGVSVQTQQFGSHSCSHCFVGFLKTFYFEITTNLQKIAIKIMERGSQFFV